MEDLSSLSLQEQAQELYNGFGLAPMVRASTTPLRILALSEKYGGGPSTNNFVYTEELIDRSITCTNRVYNKHLHTIDYVKTIDSLSKKSIKKLQKDGNNRAALLLRIDPIIEQQGQILPNNELFGDDDGDNGYNDDATPPPTSREAVAEEEAPASNNANNNSSTHTTTSSSKKKSRNKLICQLGTGEYDLALDAAKHVYKDVAAIDVNMGCPKKFSISGGMGSALLDDVERATQIIKTLRNEIPRPISCKIRFLKGGNGGSDSKNDMIGIKRTVEYIDRMINNNASNGNLGVHAIAIHARHVGDDSTNPANWEKLKQVMDIVRIKHPMTPILLNGDFYNPYETIQMIYDTKANGVIFARPALYNTSIFRCFRNIQIAKTYDSSNHHGENHILYNNNPYNPYNTTDTDDTPATIDFLKSQSSSTMLSLLDKTQVVQDYLKLAVRYDTHYKNVKYVICEMMTNRRAPSCRVPYLPQKFANSNLTISSTCACHSLQELCQLWNVNYTAATQLQQQQRAQQPVVFEGITTSAVAAAATTTTTSSESNGIVMTQGEHKYEDSYFLKDKSVMATTTTTTTTLDDDEPKSKRICLDDNGNANKSEKEEEEKKIP